MGTTRGQSIKRSLATRLAFDETIEESPSMRKLSRLDADILGSNRSGLGLRRYTSDHLDSMTTMQTENQDLKKKLKEMEVLLAGSRANEASMESKVKNLQLERDKERVEWDSERGTFVRDKQDSKDKIDDLKCKLKQVKKRESDRLEEGYRSRKSSIDRTAELELRLSKMRTDKEKIEGELLETKLALSNKPDIDKLNYNQQIQDYKTKLSDYENKELFFNTELQRMEKKKTEGEEAVMALETVKTELQMEKLRGDKLQSELDANQDAGKQRQIMREKLEKYDNLEKENIRLRSTNKLLTETAENAALLKEKVKQLENDRKRMEARCLQMNEVSAELELSKKSNKEWSNMVRDWIPADQRHETGEVTISMARDMVMRWQERELGYVDQVSSLVHAENNMKTKLASEVTSKMKLEADINKIKTEQEEQTRLVKKLQRKLLLVTRERDSFKGILDSYEKEMTVTEDNIYQDKITALEKTIAEYKAIVEMLEEDKKVGSPVAAAEAVNSVELIDLKNKLHNLQEKNEKLELELERRAIKGDFNPTDTKVLHFTNNPTAKAVEKRAAEMSELLNENTSLKARVKLLEEGQTKDLTLMVGARVEEGEGEKLRELKVELEKAEKREKRFMEAFSKTSTDFREVVYKLTGYRIDKLADNMYRLNPLYADNTDDNLMFQRAEDGEIHMLESDFSCELGDLMEEHLERDNSIPMFLSGVIKFLFNRKYGVTVDDVEDYNDGDDDDEDDQGDDDTDSDKPGSSDEELAVPDPDEPITIDSD